MGQRKVSEEYLILSWSLILILTGTIIAMIDSVDPIETAFLVHLQLSIRGPVMRGIGHFSRVIGILSNSLYLYVQCYLDTCVQNPRDEKQTQRKDAGLIKTKMPNAVQEYGSLHPW